MPSPININRWQNKVRAMLGLRGENPVPTIAELQQVVVVESDRPEWELAGGSPLWTSFAQITAVAAETAYAVFWNPPESGTIHIVESFQDNGQFLTSRWFWTTVDPATNAGFVAGNITVRDSRVPAGLLLSQVAIRLYSGTLTAAEVGAYGISTLFLPTTWAPATISQQDHRPVIIAPGFGFGFTYGAVNVRADIEVSGRQHVIERGVLS